MQKPGYIRDWHLLALLALTPPVMGFELRPPATPPLPIVMSHVIVVLDQASYDAIRTAPELQGLAATETKATQAGTISYAGLYVYGHSTYLEFFGEQGKLTGSQIGDVSLGLSSLKVGTLDQLVSRLQNTYGKEAIEIGRRVRTTAAGEMPWYAYTQFKGDTHGVDVWANELEPSYLPSQYPAAHIVDPLSRVEYQAFRYQPGKPFYDVTGLQLDISHGDAQLLRQFLDAAGWLIKPSRSGFVAHGPNLIVTAVETAASRVRRIDFRLNRKLPSSSTTRGRVHFTVAGKAGHLDFDDLRASQ